MKKGIKFKDRIIKTEKGTIGHFHANTRNPKTHGTGQRRKLKALFERYGLADTIKVYKSKRNNDEWTIFDGHGRQEVDHNQVWTIAYTDLTDEEVDSLVLMYDDITSRSDIDKAMQSDLLKDIDLGEFEELGNYLEGIAIEGGLDYSDLWGGNHYKEEDKNEKHQKEEVELSPGEELQKKWDVKEGQIWLLDSGLGWRHQLICGDCTSQVAVNRLMQGETAEILFTSPPYGSARDYGGGDLSIETLKKFVSLFEPCTRFQCVNLGLLFRGGEVLPYWDEYIEEAKSCGLKLLAWNVWDKEQGGSIASATNMFLLTHEFIFVFGKERKKLNRTIPNNLEAYIEAMTDAGDIVVDPFCGSGTTLMACQNLKRRCFSMEINPEYVAVCLERFEKATGSKATLKE